MENFLLIFGIIIIVWSINFLALYPGLFVFDASWQWDMYQGKEPLSEHHPILHTLLMGYIMEWVYSVKNSFNTGVAVYTIFQMVICALSFSYMITYVYEKIRTYPVLILSVLFISFHPTIILQVMSSTKDTCFLAFALLSMVLSLELIENPDLFSHKFTKCFGWVMSVTLMVIFRNNCIYALPFLLFFIFIFIKREKKRFVGIVLMFGILFLLYKCIFVPNVITAETDGREMLSVPVQQLMRIYNSENADIDSEEREMIEKLIEEKGRKYYDPKISDWPKAQLDMDYYKKNQAEVNGIYIDLIRRNFKLSVESFLENTCGFWYPFSKLAISYNTEAYWLFTDYSEYLVVSSKFPLVYGFYKIFESYKFAEGKPLTMLFYAPATYFYIFFIMAAYAIVQNKKKFITICVFVLMLWCTYLLGPVALVRYTTYLFALVPLYFVIIMEKDDRLIDLDKKSI